MDLTAIEIKGDRILVKKLPYQDKLGSFYIPDSVKARKLKRRADAWKAEVITVGDKVYFEDGHYTFAKGDTIYLAPVSLDCPAFEGDNGEEYIIVTQDDCLAREVMETK